MSRFQKIFLACTLVVVGFGVAKFLGQPVLPMLVVSSGSSQAPPAPVAAQTTNVASNSSQTAGRVRLLPDTSIKHSDAAAANATVAMPESPRLGSTLAPVLASSDRASISPMPPAVDVVPISSAPFVAFAAPRATLRNEAPRPIGVDPQSPAAIRRIPSEWEDVADPYKVAGPSTEPANWSAPQLLNTGYANAGQSAPTATPASYSAPANPAAESQAAPPPWPMPVESAEPRTHIVVDGDSLERLASRYLSDPQRSREIYELNRAVLSAPDLLPIGAELKIPERVASASWDRRGFQPNSANATSDREIDREKVTPVRPASAPQGIIPRAQLAPPVMVQ